MTPHISAQQKDYAETVIFPGDPKRAELLATELLTDCKKINEVRNCHGYTGRYGEREVSIQASGMGMASASIYAYELLKFYNVKRLIRIGTCGTYDASIPVGSWTVAREAITSSNIYDAAEPYASHTKFRSIKSTDRLLEKLMKDNDFTPVTVHSTDEFYQINNNELPLEYAQTVDMESFVIFLIARQFERQATTVNLCSDSVTFESTALSPSQRTMLTLDMTAAVLDALFHK